MTTNLNQEVSDVRLGVRWIKALRSGRYKQTRLGLRDECDRPGFCCLGVLCSVSRLGKWRGVSYDLNDNEICFGSLSGYLHDALERIGGVHFQSTLIGMNDARNLGFLEIANEIEKRLVAFAKKHKVKINVK